MSSDAALRVAPRDRLLGELLLDAGLVGPADLERGLALQLKLGGRIGSVLMRIGAVSEDNLLQVLSRQLGLPVMGADVPAPDEDMVRLTAAQAPTGIDWLLDQQLLVWPGEGSDLFCAARDPLLPALREAMRHAYPGRKVLWCLCRAQDLERMLDALAHHARSDEWGGGDEQQLRAMAEEAPVVELVSNLMAQAVEQRASDIHLEPEERIFAVRFRIDGVLHTRLQLPRDRFDAVASRLKLISGMDIAERRLPQDGRLSTRVGGQEMDIRVSALPGVHGESIVMRLLPKERKELGLERLGFESDHLAMMQAWTAEANGIVLVTGPTGSGKSTTLYAALAAANDGLKKIITVEDPVEFQLPAITQIQAHPDIGLTFANALRSILRQDPDVIMIGEIRDLETAEIAVQAALTGHLVLSTLHTNDAISAFTRLIDMGVEPFLVATPIRAVQAQRLVRRLCTQCARPHAVPHNIEAEAAVFAHKVLPGMAPRWMEAVGCPNCMNTGYRGRLGIYEMVPVSEAMQHLIVSGASVNEMKKLARDEGHRFLRDDGLLKAWQGLTTVEEVLRVAGT
ncbi:MAG: Flp pilus assembly complex ATPase component TadA [Thermomonas sp.]|jgi:general secretion pathway protein E|uniref:GspE/PulE family protein n=1 Tax=Thermomonas sp. TaxID=1971895 RepID=UPI001B736F03|nr:type II/IV secretion system protein [Thermomonas sp.]MBK6333694.1 Flp pilus assembly complex ATPase component TadA [Thermomonas sp.]MBK6415917.1 Flp pilus assembly complex ATPase component TadA [Thermomonas sp.]MBK6925481.1 Flp pilus assembly complex ATPase component TadA [Thermomonas sp.]MBK7205163.1 Flp pilus assembly complex ATPase component TadA [Thermomonas sp.]MBP6439301.1 Flp pilus assembly complex ATPase component TadA [Thermomonas sp.]